VRVSDVPLCPPLFSTLVDSTQPLRHLHADLRLFFALVTLIFRLVLVFFCAFPRSALRAHPHATFPRSYLPHSRDTCSFGRGPFAGVPFFSPLSPEVHCQPFFWRTVMVYPFPFFPFFPWARPRTSLRFYLTFFLPLLAPPYPPKAGVQCVSFLSFRWLFYGVRTPSAPSHFLLFPLTFAADGKAQTCANFSWPPFLFFLRFCLCPLFTSVLFHIFCAVILWNARFQSSGMTVHRVWFC